MNAVRHLVEVTLSENVAERVSAEVGHVVEREALMLALVEHTGQDVDDLATMELTYADVLVAYKNSPQFLLNSSVVDFVKLDGTIIPDGFVYARLDQRVKHRGDIWMIHKSDPDPFPSDPHAHNVLTGLKLDLGTGDLYHKRQWHSRIPHKRLLEVRSKVTRVPLPPLYEA